MTRLAAADPMAGTARDFLEILGGLDSEALLDYRFSFQGIPMWPFIRWPFFWRAHEVGLAFQPYFAEPSRPSLLKTARYLGEAWLDRPTRSARPFDILWFGLASGVVAKRDGKWFGRVNDYLVGERPDSTLLVEESVGREIRRPRWVPNTRSHDFFRLKALALGRGRNQADASAAAGLIARLKGALRLDLGDGFYRTLEANLVRLAGRLPVHYGSYSRLFDLVRPKVVFLEDGCYGYSSHILRWAKERGIPTAEFQHGALPPSHMAYNFGSAGFHPEYQRHLPDYLLVHGSFWAESTRVPSAKVVIGNPHFQANLERGPGPAARTEPQEPRLLIVSQGDVTSRLVALARQLSRQYRGFRITFRLHPAEVAFRDRYRELVGLPNLEISDSGDIYEHIRASKWIVGVSSTTIYEAAGLGKPVFVFDTPNSRFYTSRSFGTWFEDAEDLLSKLASAPSGDRGAGERIWAPDWRGNYARFLEKDLGLPPGARAASTKAA